MRVTTIATPLSPPALAQIAAVTRAAFQGAEPVPDLPTADGASETGDSVAADLEAGAWLAVARNRSGEIVGSVRAFAEQTGGLAASANLRAEVPTSAWVVRRLAVLPAMRGTGLAQALMCHLEEAAASAGAAIVRLDAVVERGNPPFYASLGYETTAHFANPDKPLSEVAMRRALGVPRLRFGYPWEGEAAPGKYAVLVTWHTNGIHTIARCHSDVDSAIAVAAQPVDGFAFAGADGCPDQIADQIAVHDGVFDGPPASIAAYRMPRTVHGNLLALWRLRTH